MLIRSVESRKRGPRPAKVEPAPRGEKDRDRGLADSLIDLVPDAIIAHTFGDGIITTWNRGAEELYGWSSAEAAGQEADRLLRTRYPVDIAFIEQVLAETGRWEGELGQVTRTGRQITVAARWNLERNRAGEPHAIVAVNTDITTRKEVGDRLQTTEEMFKLLVSRVVDYAIFMLDPRGNVVTWNKGAERIKGYSSSEIVGRHFSRFYPAEDRRAGKPDRHLEAAARAGSVESEGWRIRKDGSRFWADVVITRLLDDAGTLRGFAKVTRDITVRREQEERRRVEEQRKAAHLKQHARRMAALEKTKSDFLNLASHELRGPLAVVRGYISMIEHGDISPEGIPKVTSVIAAKVQQIHVLVEQMLEISRLENEASALEISRFDLVELVAAELERACATAPGHSLRFSQPERSVLVAGDRQRLATLVTNLLDNAIKYSPSGGVVECAVSTRGSKACISVRDFGVGIDAEHRAELFRKFSRLPVPHNNAIQGMGLGLYLSSAIASAHGGTIAVESPPDGGSRFTFMMPLASGRPRR
jgi:PAS domain S-box-containing protein